MNTLLDAQLHKAEQIGRILSCYGETAKNVIPIISQVDFEKALKTSKLKVVLNENVQKGITAATEALKNEKDNLKKSELVGQIVEEFGSLLHVKVTFNNVIKSVWVDCLNPLTKEYKDNSLTRMLGLIDLEKADKMKKLKEEKEKPEGEGDDEEEEVEVHEDTDVTEKSDDFVDRSEKDTPIGQIESEKPVFPHASHEGHTEFSKKEHKDAAKLHEKHADNHQSVINKEGYKKEHAEARDHHKKQATKHKELAEKSEY